MSIEFVGMIFPSQWSETHGVRGTFDFDYLRNHLRATVAAALLDYVDLGVTTFLNRGYDPYYDTVDYGRWIIPVVREEAARRASSGTSAAA